MILGHSKKTMKKRCQNGFPKSWKMVQNGAQGRPGSIYSLFLSIFGEGEKTWFFDEVLGRPKNKEKIPVERERLEKSAPADNKWTDRSPGVSRHSRLRIKRRTTSRWSHTPKGRRPGELLLSMVLQVVGSGFVYLVGSRSIFTLPCSRAEAQGLLLIANWRIVFDSILLNNITCVIRKMFTNFARKFKSTILDTGRWFLILMWTFRPQMARVLL